MTATSRRKILSSVFVAFMPSSLKPAGGFGVRKDFR